MTSSVILKVSHGYTVKDGDDPLVETAEITMKIFSLVMTPGRFLVDIFPISTFEALQSIVVT